MTSQILRPREAAAYLGMSRRTLYVLAERDPAFPRKIVFTRRCVGWRKDALDSWLQSKERAE